MAPVSQISGELKDLRRELSGLDADPAARGTGWSAAGKLLLRAALSQVGCA